MTMSLTVLGSSGMYATPERACSGYLVELEEQTLWLDAGAGTWRNLMRHTDFKELSGVLLSHRHPDHTTDVFQADHARCACPDTPMRPIPLWAPQETIDRLLGFAPDLGECFDIMPISPIDKVELAGAVFSFITMAHPAETLGVRIESQDAVVAYSADSGPEANFGALARDADLFICEATLQNSDDTWHGHLRASQAGALAAASGAKRLLLSHLPPGRDHEISRHEAQETGEGIEVELAQDGQRIEISA